MGMLYESRGSRNLSGPLNPSWYAGGRTFTGLVTFKSVDHE
jgi:hypothetical protein